jgi:hypothetical protein
MANLKTYVAINFKNLEKNGSMFKYVSAIETKPRGYKQIGL